jgi:DNA-directed RNA polymerase specialized sigma24 family protein
MSASRVLQGVDEYDARFAMVGDRLVRICAGFVGADSAEDAVHDSFLRGRRSYHQLRDKDLFEAWITRLAINVCLDLRRSRSRVADLVARLWTPAVHEPPRDVGLRELIERLPPRDRTLVILHYGYGYRLEEIASMTGLSAVKVRTIVFRARRRLRDQVEGVDR